MPTKNEMIHNLKNVKLVLGNGFDLHCHLKTTYSDFFHYYEEKNKYFLKWIEEFTPKARDYVDLRTANNKDFWLDFINFDKTNVWDFFFYLISREYGVDITKWRWCDIESKIEESLLDITPESGLCWLSVYELLKNGRAIDTAFLDLFVLASVVYKKNGEKKFSSKGEFFTFLLDELKLFESNFGYYIYRQHYDDINRSFGVIIPNESFRRFSKLTIDNLCDSKSLVSIDSFNYDSIEIEELEPIFHNVNGNVEAPIFGIDSDRFRYNDPRYIFSKTNRRMELDMLENETGERAEFDNIIVFGHSLNAADYSYFFSILDKIEITNLESSSKIIFAFSIYDSKKEEEIKANLRKAIFRLFQDYSKYKGNELFPNRLLDALTTQGKVLMFEIPYIDVNPKPGYFRR